MPGLIALTECNIGICPPGVNRQVIPPRAAFTVTCPTLQCSLDASASTGAIASYTWTANGRTERHAYPTAKLTFPSAGRYTITLRVTDSTGHYRTLTKKGVLVPSLAPSRVDTVIVHDTAAYLVTLPTFPTMSGLVVDSTMQGQGFRVYRLCLLGMADRKPTGAVEIFPNSGMVPSPANAVTITGLFRSAGVRWTLALAVAALDSGKVCQ